ncbi:S-layer family protein [Methanocaldococcus infernus ME]|uniref:S-layer family protein n=1 Tax=Methanocaldococcus infernus (strain DSM 11812 / JCM 15783 / ME) TaxID=573063 RepID=D5VSJ2_METIM|nr:S-layer protein [Methanocaldococcus infernus]ADG13545.1 S-layer family protein [Methanocaldococcus infernus ME]
MVKKIVIFYIFLILGLNVIYAEYLEDILKDNVKINGDLEGNVYGKVTGFGVNLDINTKIPQGFLNGEIKNGKISLNIKGNVLGNIVGDFPLIGYKNINLKDAKFVGSIDGTINNGNIIGTFNGEIVGKVGSFDFNEVISGEFNGYISGNTIKGSYKGKISGIVNGDCSGNVEFKIVSLNINKEEIDTKENGDIKEASTKEAKDIKKIDTKDLKKYFINRAEIVAGKGIDLKFGYELKKYDLTLISKNIEITKDTILIGGPVANPLTKKLMDKFPVKVTNEYPGKNKGVIEMIKLNVKVSDNIYKEVKVLLLAGSDRWGTKAAVEYFKTLDYIPEEPIFVEWKDGKAVRIEKP